MNLLVYWSDSRTLYFGVVGALIWVLAGLVLAPSLREGSRLQQPWRGLFSGISSSGVFLAVVVCLIFAGRWPGLFFPKAFNPDEDQLIVAAMGLAEDPVFFRGAECGSSGPLNVYPLLLPLLFGGEIGLFGARLVGLLMVAASVCSIYIAARAAVPEAAARGAAAGLAVLLGLTHFWDFTHYTSEHAPVHFLTIGWAATAWFVTGDRFSIRRRLSLAGLAALAFALVPYAKLQATLLALSSGIFLLVVTFLVFRRQPVLLRRSLTVIVLGAAAFPVLFSLLLLFAGVFDYFWASYIQSALAYKGAGGTGMSRWALFPRVLLAEGAMRPADLLLYLSGVLVFSLVAIPLALSPTRQGCAKKTAVFCGLSLVVVFITIWTVTSTMRNYPHYFYFLPFAIAMAVAGLSGVVLGRLQLGRDVQPARKRLLELAFMVLLLLATMYPVADFFFSTPHPRVGQARHWERTHTPSRIATKIQEIASESRSDGASPRLTVWGYNPVYYRETRMPSATRLSTSSALFDENSMRDFFRREYFSDLVKNPPAVFVDAVAPGQFVMMNDRDKFGFENIAEIAEFVRSRYDLVTEIDGVRIFRLKEN